MAFFASTNYNSAKYVAFRPAYPPAIFETTLGFHTGSFDVLLDLGCGHAPVAHALAGHFQLVHAVDPSASMLETAKQLAGNVSSASGATISFHQGSAESLPFLGDASIDLLIAAAAAHWFDFDRVWPELARVVRPGGTLAFWVYKEGVLPHHPAANQIVAEHCFGTRSDEEGDAQLRDNTMGDLFQQPGRSYMKELMRSVVLPSADWTDETRIVYEPESNGPGNNLSTLGVRPLLFKTMRLGDYAQYVRTLSAYRGWADRHPQRKQRADGGSGDFVDVMMDRAVAAEPAWTAAGESWPDLEVEVEWGSVILLARRRSVIT
ncbi:trans-aconitate methyltransferase 1 [Grosmannia clavigera kw1407]|uniref:Trans-aconitate methyltransferase 1 n=1 Tax=Grosmannia clavigera (strain kw1407 / UAMH 11150) TaxID=655863 RepID=F0X961_GROCL|nr:trans-aconitate methyltransferase 1 [Grosmannia clavigera kw1407]EFX05823.1 trans-aconitate methyltransferase 1 [Grosmannia clavigera kw1407]